MRSKLKSVTQQLIVVKNTLDNIKSEHQDLRISCLKLGTGIKPAIRGVIKQVSFVFCSSHVSRHQVRGYLVYTGMIFSISVLNGNSMFVFLTDCAAYRRNR